MDADGSVGRLLDGGISDQLRAALRNVADATTPDGELKYTARVSWELKKMIACRTYTKHVFQLCHLINGIDAGGRGTGGYLVFFFGLGKAKARTFAHAFDQALASAGGRGERLVRTEAGISMHYDDGEFGVTFGRMPLLAALLEFLIETAGYAEIDAAIEEMLASPSKRKAVEAASNRISRTLYDYLSDHLPSVQNKVKYEQLMAFLQSRKSERLIEIDDEAILEFWLEKSDDPDGGDFRTYQSVFDRFVALIRTLDAGQAYRSADQAAAIGGDFEAGEVDPDELSAAVDAIGEWQSPLAALVNDPVSRIKFLNDGERKALESLMGCGPLARDLPLSLLRYEVFGFSQSRIRQARRKKIADDEMRVLISCRDAETYPQRIARYRQLVDHVERVLRAALYVLMRQSDHEDDDNVVGFHQDDPVGMFNAASRTDTDIDDDQLAAGMSEAQAAFIQFNRAGFKEETIFEPDMIEGFRVGSGAIVAVRQQLERYLVVIAGIDQGLPDLTALCKQDSRVFSAQFGRIYGEAT